MSILKNLLIRFFILFTLTVTSQTNNEFTTYDSGLIYSDLTMNKLSYIVDSLNLKYYSCELNKDYYSKKQGMGFSLQYEGEQIENAIKDIQNNISFDEFLKKYPETKSKKNLLFVRYDYTNYKNVEMVEFDGTNPIKNTEFSIRIPKKEADRQKEHIHWKFEHKEESKYSSESLSMIYLPDELTRQTLPKEYSKMIGYSECLIDTTVSKIKDNADRGGTIALPENWRELSEKKKAKLLDELRSTKVVGGCSMDTRPREHAFDISLLSAETINWQIFLKAHLDIMNDNFERMSDGSYAWGNRKTYIKELEELNINVYDLLLGISFRIDNPTQHHYYGNIRRLGRAFSETNNKEQLEKILLDIISNEKLDLYNRMIGYYLLDNYIYNLQDESKNSLLNQAEKELNIFAE